ncbi:D-alanyl-D-alanine carboxypeptidase family protein [Allopontixanthobacter sp.]|uniref:D-alanyl-D-alanine carboxypeptidase family protein n=1 Tax=Allopontixanthobacter sp. TaxID=2906452 RepID=UPI002AB95209|nr:D-alanyl-D-alanine carboxypeptidase family protein [Allopontixanthobacter sp.]MDZ4306658.1 D-alanyl-D-alanine carboxypeptidase family protein [Allopontixanthobacter sp.]
MALSVVTAAAPLLAYSPVSSPERVAKPGDLGVPGADLAPIALLVDLNSGQELMARDADRRFVPASITKVMTLYVAFELIDEGKLSPTNIFTVRPETFKEWRNKGSRMFLPHDARVSVDELLIGIAAVSANDGSIVLAEGAAGSIDNWLGLMNAKARELGMRSSHFGTPNGWPDEGRTYTTARDLVILSRAIMNRHPYKYARYFGREGFAYNGIAQANHDPMIGIVEGADGMKTGFTNEAGYGFLGTAVRNGRRLVMVVAASDTHQRRKQAAYQLIEWGFNRFDTRPLFAAGATVGVADVQNGMQSGVPLSAPANINATFPVGRGQGDVKLTIHYEGPLQAPVRQGERIAELEIEVDGLPPSRVPLVTAEAVEKADIWRRLVNGITGIFS